MPLWYRHAASRLLLLMGAQFYTREKQARPSCSTGEPARLALCLRKPQKPLARAFPPSKPRKIRDPLLLKGGCVSHSIFRHAAYATLPFLRAILRDVVLTSEARCGSTTSCAGLLGICASLSLRAVNGTKLRAADRHSAARTISIVKVAHQPLQHPNVGCGSSGRLSKSAPGSTPHLLSALQNGQLCPGTEALVIG